MRLVRVGKGPEHSFSIFKYMNIYYVENIWRYLLMIKGKVLGTSIFSNEIQLNNILLKIYNGSLTLTYAPLSVSVSLSPTPYCSPPPPLSLVSSMFPGLISSFLFFTEVQWWYLH